MAQNDLNKNNRNLLQGLQENPWDRIYNVWRDGIGR